MISLRQSGNVSVPLLLLLLAMCCGGPALRGEEPIGPNEGLPVVSWKEADQVVGRVALVYGKIVDVGHTERVHFLNFKRGDRKAFVTVVFSEALEKNFSESLESSYLNQLVQVRGTVSLFKGSPQIVVSKPAQITILNELPESSIPQRSLVVLSDELIIGTYNIKNLFDDVDDPYHNDETTPAKPREEMQNVAGVIREINADVLALQEVENRGYLERFVGAFLPDMGYEHVVLMEGNDGRGIDCGLLSRIPVGKVTSHRHVVFPAVDGSEQSFNRDLICIELLPKDGSPFEMWVVHLKSNSGGREEAEPIRLGESRMVHQIVSDRLRQNPDANFILCGDFNDTFGSPTITTILGNPPLLKPLFEDAPVETRITYNREPFLNQIDFLLCSPAMHARYVPKSYAIRLGTDSASGSDHNPVSARFKKTADLMSTKAAQMPPAIANPQQDQVAAYPSRYASDAEPANRAAGGQRAATAQRWMWFALGMGFVAILLLGTRLLRRR